MNLAGNYVDQGYPPAEPLYRRLLAIQESAWGDNVNLITPLNAGYALQAVGQYGQAEPC